MFKINWERSIDKELEKFLYNSKESAYESLNTLKNKKNNQIIGFMDSPIMDTAKIKEMAKWINNHYDTLVVLGIGGSSLGAKTIISALSDNKIKTKVLIVDNIDSDYFHEIINSIDISKTVFNVISKSGSTAETMSQFLIIFDLLSKKLGKEKAIEQIIFTTDPVSGALRKLATEMGFKTLDIPSNVGGRFSVLTAVGLLPSAVADINIDEMLSGANEVVEKGLSASIDNPVLKYTMIKYIYYLKGFNNTVIMPYSSKLAQLSNWYVQLWAESLGKMGIGQTPIPAVGASDQHSQLQLFMSGPKNKFITFIGIENAKHDIMIPDFIKEVDAFSYLSKHSLNKLIRSEMLSTEKALCENGVPSVRFELDYLNPYNIGALFMFFEIAVALTGEIFGIDAFDQPGVEQSKIYTYQMMGRKGY